MKIIAILLWTVATGYFFYHKRTLTEKQGATAVTLATIGVVIAIL